MLVGRFSGLQRADRRYDRKLWMSGGGRATLGVENQINDKPRNEHDHQEPTIPVHRSQLKPSLPERSGGHAAAGSPANAPISS